MKRIEFFLGVMLSCLWLQTAAQQQEVEKDVESWVGIKLRKEFDFDLKLSLEQQVRFLDYQQTFTEAVAEYTALGMINVGTEMRFKFLKGGGTEYRLAGFFGLQAGKKDLELEYRFKTTSNFSRFDDPLVVLRNKLSAKYTIKKDWRVEASFETFLPREEGRFWLRKYRWMLELRYRFTKKHLLNVFYAIDRTGDLDPDDSIVLQHIFGTRYDIRW